MRSLSLLIFVWFALLEPRSSLSHQQEPETETHQNESTHKRDKAKDSTENSSSSGVDQRPARQTDEQEGANSTGDTNGEPDLPWPLRTPWLTVWLTAIYIVVNILMLRAIHGQSRHMERQLDHMQGSVRPWIGMQRIESDSIVISSGGAVHTSIKVVFENFGNNPASVSAPHLAMLVLDPNDAGREVSTALNSYISGNASRGALELTSIVFPKGSYTYDNFSPIWTPAIPIDTCKFLVVFLVGVIRYTEPSVAPSERIGSLRRILKIGRSSDREPVSHRTAFSYVYQYPDSANLVPLAYCPGTTMQPGVWHEWKTIAD